MTHDIIRNSFYEALNTLQAFMANEDNLLAVEKAANALATALKEGNKVMSCGNGGSLCDATHFAEELTGRFRNNRNPLPAIALNDAAHLTCVANDYTFDEVFSRPVEALGQKGDVLLAISTSGNSRNIIQAVKAAHRKGLTVIGLTSNSDNTLRRMADIAICAPRTPHSDRIQEIHIKVIHIMIEALEAQLETNK